MKILLVSLLLLLEIRGGFTGRIKTHSFLIPPIDRRLNSRKTMVITGNGQPTTDASIYTRAPNPPGNFIFKIPPVPGNYVAKAGPVESTVQHPLHSAQISMLTDKGQQVVQMPANQYQQLYDRANSNRFTTPSALARNDFQSKFLGQTQNFASKFADKTSTLGSVGSTFLSNVLKIQNGIVNNAQNEYLNVYAANKNADLAVAAGEAVSSVQSNQLNTIQSNPTNTVTPAMPASSSMYTSSYASGYRSKI